MYFLKVIENRMEELDINWNTLSKMSGVPNNTLYELKNRKRCSLTVRNTIKVFNALELDLNELKKIDWRDK